jgi:hypothetical protein
MKETAVEWLIKELDNYEKGISEYFSKVAIYNHARRMERTMKQTAVEWLREKLWKEFNFSFSDNILEQAKEMEKEQIESAFTQGELFAVDYFDADKPNEDCSKNYYNKTFN